MMRMMMMKIRETALFIGLCSSEMAEQNGLLAAGHRLVLSREGPF